MNFFNKKDFKTKEEQLKKQKRITLKKQEQKFNSSLGIKRSTNSTMETHHNVRVGLQDIFKGQVTPEIDRAIQKKALSFEKQGDKQLYCSMQKRLHELQLLKKHQRQQLKSLASQIQSLKTEKSISKAIGPENLDFEQKQKMVMENKSLKGRMSEMEAYLNANGAFWQGEKIVGQFKIKQVKQHIKNSKLNYRTPNHFQFETLCKRVQELNESLLMQLGTTKIVSANGINSFSKADTLKLTFYKNLMQIESMGNFQYNNMSGLKILNDLNEGYYPRVCKDKYPNGVLIEIVNNLHLQYTQQMNNSSNDKQWFFGKGFALIDDQ